MPPTFISYPGLLGSRLLIWPVPADGADGADGGGRISLQNTQPLRGTQSFFSPFTATSLPSPDASIDPQQRQLGDLRADPAAGADPALLPQHPVSHSAHAWAPRLCPWGSPGPTPAFGAKAPGPELGETGTRGGGRRNEGGGGTAGRGIPRGPRGRSRPAEAFALPREAAGPLETPLSIATQSLPGKIPK